jgi:hypothetical protein
MTGAVLEEFGRARPYAESMPIVVGELELDDPDGAVGRIPSGRYHGSRYTGRRWS